MQIELAYTQHCGKWHRSQQDALWDGHVCHQTTDLPVSGYTLKNPDVLLAVADGVSVSPSPHLASRFVLESLAQGHAISASLDAALVRRVHGQLCDRYARGRTFGSSTTLMAAHVNGTHCVVVNVGDSRAYHVDGEGRWQQLSRDHTVLERLISEGKAERGTQYAKLYDALEYCLIADDTETEFRIHRSETNCMPDDTLVLCTDGVHDCLGQATLERLLVPQRPVKEQVEMWRHAILAAGAPDNFSLIATRFCGDDA